MIVNITPQDTITTTEVNGEDPTYKNKTRTRTDTDIDTDTDTEKDQGRNQEQDGNKKRM